VAAQRQANAAAPRAELVTSIRMPNGVLIKVDSLMFRWPSADLPCLIIESFQVSAGDRALSREINPRHRGKLSTNSHNSRSSSASGVVMNSGEIDLTRSCTHHKIVLWCRTVRRKNVVAP
jgi:hypothetical protein